jgi:hypothetical protein
MLNVTLLIKITACLAGLAVSVASFRLSWWKNVPLSKLLLLGYSWRYLFFFAWFVLLSGHVGGDVRGYDLHTRWTMDGLVPNRDFNTPYGFYLNYFNSIIYSIWKNPIALVGAYQICELLGSYWIAKLLSKYVHIGFAKHYLILYCFNPLVISSFAFDGQEESLLIPFIALLLFCHFKNFSRISGIASSIMIFLVKASSLLVSAPFIVLTRSRKDAVALFLLGSALLSVLPLSLGSKTFSSTFSRLNNEGDQLNTLIMPGNFWFVVRKFGIDLSDNPIPTIILLVSFTTLIALIWFRRRNQNSILQLSIACILSTLIYQIFSPYTSPNFLAIIVPFVSVLLLYVHFSQYKYNCRITSLILFWSLITSLDIPVYFRFTGELKQYVVGQSISLRWLGDTFVAWQVLIVLMNICLFLILIKFYLKNQLSIFEFDESVLKVFNILP